MRWALVPPSLANDQAAHDAAAFAWGCYSAEEVRCSGKAERVKYYWKDQKRLSYRSQIEVPTHVPDGDYVLGWVWYGSFNHNIGTFSASSGAGAGVRGCSGCRQACGRKF